VRNLNDKSVHSLRTSLPSVRRHRHALAEIYVNYEQQPEYPLVRIEKPGAHLDWRVERMKLSKDKRSLIYNDFYSEWNSAGGV
jgi:predicted helicase